MRGGQALYQVLPLKPSDHRLRLCQSTIKFIPIYSTSIVHKKNKPFFQIDTFRSLNKPVTKS
jgi:hypothetical protein